LRPSGAFTRVRLLNKSEGSTGNDKCTTEPVKCISADSHAQPWKTNKDPPSFSITIGGHANNLRNEQSSSSQPRRVIVQGTSKKNGPPHVMAPTMSR